MPPNNIFTAADAKSSAAVNRFYGERLRFLPMTQGGGYTTQSGSDSTRSIQDFHGVLSGPIDTQNLSGQDRAQTFGQNFNTRDRAVSIETAEMLAKMPDGVRNGDRIQALDQTGQPIYEVAGDAFDDGTGNRFIIPLVTT